MPSLILLLLAVPYFSLASDDLRCYVCELEGTEACEDPFDVAQVNSALCSSLAYTTRVRQGDDLIENPDELVKIDGKFRVGPILNKMFHRNDTQNGSFKYACVKAELESGSDRGITRRCVKVPRDVDDICDYIKGEVPENVRVKSCNVCETDNCNSGSFLAANFVVVFFSVISFILVLNQ